MDECWPELGVFEIQEGIAECPHCNAKIKVWRMSDAVCMAQRCNECNGIFSLFGYQKDKAKVEWGKIE